MSALKVINITEEGRFGGPQKRITEVAEGLKTYDIETVVICPKENAERFQGLLKAQGIKFYALSLHRLTKNPTELFKFIFYFFFELFAIIKVIRKEKPNLVHCNGAWQIKGVIAAKLTGTRCVWHMNDTHFTGLVMALYKVTAKLFGDFFLGASERALHYYQPNIKATDKNIIQAPIRTVDFNPAITAASPTIDRKGSINILTVGHLNTIKGYDTLIPAIGILNQLTDKKVNFYVVGKMLDNLKEFTQNLLDEQKTLGIKNLHFLGERRDVKELLAASDIYVCPSDYEASPISVWEALAMAKPTVSTDVGDVAEIFAQHHCGLVVPTKNPEALAKAILILVDDAAQRKTLGENARRTAIDFFDIEVCVRKHAQLYQDLAGITIKNGTGVSI
ncbi:MAG: glycosyltransferase [Saprospiraceae bacterium]